MRRQETEQKTERCDLCGLPVSDGRGTKVESGGSVFCCEGCRRVSETLGEETLEDAVGEKEDGEREIPEGHETTHLHVSGMYCKACELFVEKTAEGEEGVSGAEVSYATETGRFDYDPDVLDEDELTSKVSRGGYEAYTKYDEEARREERNEAHGRFIVGGFFGMMVMVWYTFFLYPKYFGYEPLFELSSAGGYFLFGNIFVASSVVLFYTGYPLLRGAYVGLRARSPNMDLLVVLAAVSAYIYSTVALSLGRTDLYYDVSVAVILVVSFGGYYERRVKRRALESLKNVTEARVEEARLADGGTVPTEEVDEGDEILVREGERAPTDGVVIEGEGAVDESVVTGESTPVTKREGDYVVGGSLVTENALIVERVGEEGEGALDRLVDVMWDLQSADSGVQRLAGRLATVFVPLVLAVAVVVFFATAYVSGIERAALSSLTVLIVSCPCALGLATPLALATGVKTAVENGIVVSDDTVFERVRDVDIFVFDKTGTLTTGSLELLGYEGDEKALKYASKVETLSSHPIAEAISSATDDFDTAEVTEFRTLNKGVEGRVDGERVVVGHPDVFDGDTETEWEIDEETRERIERAGRQGLPVVVGWSGKVRGVLTVGEKEREGWEAVLREVGKEARVVVLTGDESEWTQRYADSEAVDEVFEGVPPEAKAETVERLRTEGTVAMVGDGTNDAPALAASDLGIAMGGGTALASDAADITILDDDLSKVPLVIRVSQATRRRIHENLGWGFFYNFVAIPLAVAGLLNPLLAAGAMATSSLLVTLNSARDLV